MVAIEDITCPSLRKGYDGAYESAMGKAKKSAIVIERVNGIKVTYSSKRKVEGSGKCRGGRRVGVYLTLQRPTHSGVVQDYSNNPDGFDMVKCWSLAKTFDERITLGKKEVCMTVCGQIV